jgi:hypothetical protein
MTDDYDRTMSVLVNGERFVKLSKAGDYAGAMLEYVRRFDYVSFVELQNALSSYFETRGDVRILLGDTNIVLWDGVTEEFAEALETLRATKKLGITPASWLTYMMDGGCLKLPFAKRPPKNGYKDPHWAPVSELRRIPLLGTWLNKAHSGRIESPAPAMNTVALDAICLHTSGHFCLHP